MNEHSDCSEPPDDDGIAADYATLSVSTNYQVAVAVDFYELKRAKGRVSSLESRVESDQARKFIALVALK